MSTLILGSIHEKEHIKKPKRKKLSSGGENIHDLLLFLWTQKFDLFCCWGIVVTIKVENLLEIAVNVHIIGYDLQGRWCCGLVDCCWSNILSCPTYAILLIKYKATLLTKYIYNKCLLTGNIMCNDKYTFTILLRSARVSNVPWENDSDWVGFKILNQILA